MPSCPSRIRKGAGRGWNRVGLFASALCRVGGCRAFEDLNAACAGGLVSACARGQEGGRQASTSLEALNGYKTYAAQCSASSCSCPRRPGRCSWWRRPRQRRGFFVGQMASYETDVFREGNRKLTPSAGCAAAPAAAHPAGSSTRGTSWSGGCRAGRCCWRPRT